MRRFLPFLAPLLSLALFLLSRAHPLHALEFPDPDFGYLFSSLTLLHGASPWHVDHPGTPLQVLGALVMLLRHVLAGTEANLTRDFFLHPLAYQQALLTTCFALFAAAQWWCGRALLALGAGAALTLFAQLAPFLVWDGVVYLDHVSPETLLSAAFLLLVPVLAPGPALRRPTRQAIAAGLLLALAAALKSTALPLLLLLFLLPGSRARLTGAAAFLAGYAAFTAPVWPQLPRMLGWLAQVTLHAGNYGTGAGGGLLEAARSYPWSVLGCLPLLLSLLYVASPVLRARFGAVPWPLRAAAVLTLFLLLKQPTARYLLVLAPVVSLAALHACAHPVFARRLSGGLWLAALLPAAAFYPFLFADQLSIRARAAENIEQLEKVLTEKYAACHVTVIEDVGIPAFTLFSGNLATERERFGPELRELYPAYAFRSPNYDAFRVSGGPLAESQWARRAYSYPCRVFLGKQQYSLVSFERIFSEAPRVLESIGPRGYFHVMAPPAALEARYGRKAQGRP